MAELETLDALKGLSEADSESALSAMNESQGMRDMFDVSAEDSFTIKDNELMAGDNKINMENIKELEDSGLLDKNISDFTSDDIKKVSETLSNGSEDLKNQIKESLESDKDASSVVEKSDNEVKEAAENITEEDAKTVRNKVNDVLKDGDAMKEGKKPPPEGSRIMSLEGLGKGLMLVTGLFLAFSLFHDLDSLLDSVQKQLSGCFLIDRKTGKKCKVRIFSCNNAKDAGGDGTVTVMVCNKADHTGKGCGKYFDGDCYSTSVNKDPQGRTSQCTYVDKNNGDCWHRLGNVTDFCEEKNEKDGGCGSKEKGICSGCCTKLKVPTSKQAVCQKASRMESLLRTAEGLGIQAIRPVSSWWKNMWDSFKIPIIVIGCIVILFLLFGLLKSIMSDNN
jgi:hypothetical protein